MAWAWAAFISWRLDPSLLRRMLEKKSNRQAPIVSYKPSGSCPYLVRFKLNLRVLGAYSRKILKFRFLRDAKWCILYKLFLKAISIFGNRSFLSNKLVRPTQSHSTTIRSNLGVNLGGHTWKSSYLAKFCKKPRLGNPWYQPLIVKNLRG